MSSFTADELDAAIDGLHARLDETITQLCMLLNWRQGVEHTSSVAGYSILVDERFWSKNGWEGASVSWINRPEQPQHISTAIMATGLSSWVAAQANTD